MSKAYSDDFWGRVRQRMMDLGLSMTDLSRLSGLPYGSIYRQINGGLVPSKHEHLENIASVLGCSVDYLLTGEKKEDNTLSTELMELVTHFKVLDDGQKKCVLGLISQFTKDNQAYAEVYLQLHSEKIYDLIYYFPQFRQNRSKTEKYPRKTADIGNNPL